MLIFQEFPDLADRGQDLMAFISKDIIAAFPDGANTTCKSGDLKMTAGDAGNN